MASALSRWPRSAAAELLVPAIASALGFTFHGPADPKAQLLAYLRAKDMLLVLDNFEQLLAGGAAGQRPAGGLPRI